MTTFSKQTTRHIDNIFSCCTCNSMPDLLQHPPSGSYTSEDAVALPSDFSPPTAVENIEHLWKEHIHTNLGYGLAPTNLGSS